MAYRQPANRDRAANHLASLLMRLRGNRKWVWWACGGLRDCDLAGSTSAYPPRVSANSTRTVPPGFLWRAACRHGLSCTTKRNNCTEMKIEQIQATESCSRTVAAALHVSGVHVHDLVLLGRRRRHTPLQATNS